MTDSIFVIGCGSIGERHIRNLRSLGEGNISAFDPDAKRLEEISRRYEVSRCDGVEGGLHRKPTIVLVCTPPTMHIEVARQAVDVGCHVFIEKPISNTMFGVDELLALAEKEKRIVYVGYNLRFNEGLLRLKQMIDECVIGRVLSIRAEFGQYLPDWRPNTDYRHGYAARAALGGGIILDASHELDYVRRLGGEVDALCCTAGKLSGLDIDVEDTAEIALRLKESIIAQVHLDCVQRSYTRTCKVIGEQGTLLLDFMSGLSHYDANEGCWHEYPGMPDPNDAYMDEMRHFLACVNGDEQPIVDGRTGKRVLEMALAATRSAASGKEETL